MTETTDTAANGADNQPQIGLIAQYVKDLSFENPNSPGVYQWQEQPQIDINFNISNNQIADDVYEVALKVSAKAVADQGTAFAVELVFAGLFGIRNVPEDQMRPPLMLDPIDFGALYIQQQAQIEAAAQGAPVGNA